MAIQVHILPAADLSLRDPQATELGRRILSNSIELIDELGLEDFTFKKLAARLNSAEASVYRYFSNKHQLLLYLVCWYWDWVHHIVNRAILIERTAADRLRAAIEALSRPYLVNPDVPYINERLLHRIVINEGSKAYHPGFPYPRTLATSLFEMAHNHPYFAEHLPRLTELKADDKMSERLADMLCFWVEGLLK